MSVTDYPTIAQATRLTEDFRDPVVSHLIWWGMERIKKGEMMGMSQTLWTVGKFSYFINFALQDKLMAERELIYWMAKDFIRVMHINNGSANA